jgi:hypothetical protein
MATGMYSARLNSVAWAAGAFGGLGIVCACAPIEIASSSANLNIAFP